MSIMAIIKYKRNIQLHQHSKRTVFFDNYNCYGINLYVPTR